MKIVAIEGVIALCAARGVERRASLFLMQHEDLAVGDFVLIQSGHVTTRISPEDAAVTWALYDEMLEAERPAQPGA